jgi:DMSO/TMAO reductase YedYZ heme-binding membrane subunit
MKAEAILLIILVVMIVASLIFRSKFKDKLSKPKALKIMGWILVVCACLAFILDLTANLLESFKTGYLDFALQIVGSICFLLLGIRLIKKGKENPANKLQKP